MVLSVFEARLCRQTTSHRNVFDMRGMQNDLAVTLSHSLSICSSSDSPVRRTTVSMMVCHAVYPITCFTSESAIQASRPPHQL
jgi:hypothetical protein